MSEKTFIIDLSRGISISCTLNLPTVDSRASVVLILHGYSSDKNSTGNKLIASSLAAKGIASIRFDFEGHGSSSGSTENLTIKSAVSDTLDILDHLKIFDEMDLDRLGIIASSFGGAVALRLISKLSNVTAIALRAPVSDYSEVRRSQLGDKGIQHWKTTGFTHIGDIKSPFEFYLDSKRNTAYKVAGSVLVPLLILHGDIDTNVSINQSKKLIQLWGGKATLKVLQGVEHGFREAGAMAEWVEDSSTFLSKYLQKL